MAYSKEWVELLNTIRDFQDSNEYTWFRGMIDCDFKLNSGLYREEKVSDLSTYISTERFRYELFRRMGYMHIKEDEWNLLFLMQHFRVGTRLLDWSESFAVALYFALDNAEPDKDGVIWMLDPLSLNELSRDKRAFFTPRNAYTKYMEKAMKEDDLEVGIFANSLALYPMRNSSRIVAQHGMFTLQGTAGVPLEDEHNGKLIEQGILKKVLIKREMREDAEAFLKQSGISSFSMFPDLEGLAKYINKEGYRKKNDKDAVDTVGEE
ncbi:FRG domain-containing protein [Terribacillus halophilus]|uniref:FRG domain-containing protein n=1 Tax=Terribacillus halophilus TaxID=361279 RepID=UPI003981E6D5